MKNHSSARIHEWDFLGVSEIGASHRISQLPNQDAWLSRRIVRPQASSDLFFFCIADGAGSAKYAEHGARLASLSAEQFLTRNFERLWDTAPKKLSEQFVAEHWYRLNRWRRSRRVALGALASTLAAVVIADGGGWAAMHIGDGAIFVMEDNELRLVSSPKKGEFVNETFFMTDFSAAQNIHWTIVPPTTNKSHHCENVPNHQDNSFSENRDQQFDSLPTGFALFTDGLEPTLLASKRREPAPAIQKMLGWFHDLPKAVVEQAVQRNVKEVLAPRTHDDCTLLLARRILPSKSVSACH